MDGLAEGRLQKIFVIYWGWVKEERGMFYYRAVRRLWGLDLEEQKERGRFAYLHTAYLFPW